MNKTLEIKEIQINEFEKLDEIFYEQQLFHSKLSGCPYPERFLQINIEKYKKYMENKFKLCVFAAFINNEIIGFVSASINNDNRGYVEDLFVKEECRNMKIGKKLFSKILEWFDENKIKRMELHVSTGNEKVLGFYEKFGLKKDGYTLMKQ